jgi:hypothetical protein
VPIKKIILLAVEGAGYSVFPSIIRQDYVEWKTSNPGVKPRNDYSSIGWGVLAAVTRTSGLARPIRLTEVDTGGTQIPKSKMGGDLPSFQVGLGKEGTSDVDCQERIDGNRDQ